MWLECFRILVSFSGLRCALLQEVVDKMARVSSVEPSKLFEHIRQGKPIMECIDSGDSVTQANHFG